MALSVALQIAVLCTFSLFFSDAVDIKWCHIASKAEDCQNLATTIPTIKCVSAPNIYRCMQLVKDGIADVLKVDDKQLYPAGKIGLKPLLRIVHDNANNYRYRAVAVVKAGGKITSLAKLKDAKSCHTGAGKTTGWTVPVSNLIKMKIITPLKDCYSSTENVGNFFTSSCVPGAMSARYNPFNLNPPRLCGLCKDASHSCSPNDEYAGYDGAIKCLESTEADIAFVKHETMMDADKSKYKLLCPDGKTKELNEHATCNWAVRPSDTIVVSPKATNSAEIAQSLKEMFVNMKEALKWQNVKELTTTNKDYSAIMGEGFKTTFEYYHTCENALRWCTISDAEFKKCTDIKFAFMAKRATNKLECIKAKDPADCMVKIEQKKADFVVLDGGDISTAMKSCKLEPVIAEDYGVATASYYAVAVVKATAKFTIRDLKGKKSCHTGIEKTSGWKTPVSYLIKNKMMPKGDSIPLEVGKFFSASCVPGALDPTYNPKKTNPKNLCALCPKNGTDCQRNPENKYYDYSGAFRCLVETDADVAFIKHATVPESTDGKGKEDWEKGLKSSDYRLLCKDGKVALIDQWENCHLAKVPAHAVVVRKGETKLGELLFRVFSNFDLSSDESKELLFSSPDGNNLLFKDSTTGLIHIEKPDKFLGDDYLEILKVFSSDIKVCSGSSHVITSVILMVFTLLTYLA